MQTQSYTVTDLVYSFQSLFSHAESDEILNHEPAGEAEPTIGGYDEYTIKLNPTYVKRVSECVATFLDSLRIGNNYIYNCSRLANITGIIERHSDLEVRLEPKHYIQNFVVISYLTQFEMGEIIFPQHGIIFKPEKGDTLIFPTGPYFQHLVNPAIGERRIMRSEFYLDIESTGMKVDRKLWRRNNLTA